MGEGADAMAWQWEKMQKKQWDPASFLGSPSHGSANSRETAVIIINTSIARADVFEAIWANASLRMCADGGANRLFDAFVNHESHIPDLIKGDLDSLRDDVREFYEGRAVPIIVDKDQYATDLGKCIESVKEIEQSKGKQYQVIIFGGLSGRFDQTAHTIHALYKLRKARDWSWIVSEESLTCLLDTGFHELIQPRIYLGPTCGILPIGVDRARVTTTGLEWDLTNAETSFDGMLSTSNHLVKELITVQTDRPVLWTAELRTA
ncbi:MAG: hypothetical protein CYPHOPRED_000272 [Cyphobasidiales sp. Tagirdzhanova-0007]|nr:MAG: hypothetical protein CYPHOPRED_000272 [Cyphobasidiales sp. Tagirdzhanova-0007]